MFDQDLCGTCDMNLTLGSVVPLAMFFLSTPLPQSASTTMIKKHTRTHTLTMATQTMESEPEVNFRTPIHRFPKLELNLQASLTASKVTKLLEEEPTRVEEYKSSGTSDVWQTFRMISVDGQPAGFAR